MDSTTWNCLPTEMKLTVVNLLEYEDVKSMSKVNRDAYYLSLPAIFKVSFFTFQAFTNVNRFQTVQLSSFEALQRFLDAVPRIYYQHIIELDLSTQATGCLPAGSHPRTDAVVSLLSGCSRLQNLSLKLDGSLANHVIPTFSQLPHLKQLSINNCAAEEETPLYVYMPLY